MSSARPWRSACSSSGRNRPATSAWTVSTMNLRSERLLNSKLVALRCHSHCSPSELKMPWPRKSSIELRRQQVAHGVVGEARLGYVLNVVRVGGDDDAGQAGGFEGRGLRRAPLRNLDGRFDKAVAVLGQVRKPADDRVGLEVAV